MSRYRARVQLNAFLGRAGLRFIGTLAAAVGVASGQTDVVLTSPVELDKLSRLAAELNGVNLLYDPQLLRGRPLSIQQASGLSSGELWSTLGWALRSRDLVTVRIDGSDAMAVVAVATAAGVAAESPWDIESPIGPSYSKFRIPLREAASAEFIAALQSATSRAHGKVVAIEQPPAIIVSDYTETARAIADTVRRVDAEVGSITRAAYEVNGSAAKLIAAAQAFVQSEVTAGKRLPGGAMLASTSDRSVHVFGTTGDVERWVAALGAVDESTSRELFPYVVPPGARAEAVRLVQESGSLLDPPVARDEITVVTDVEPGRLLVKAPAEVHELVASLLGALSTEGSSFERQRQTYVVRNRDPQEVLDLLQRLLSAEATPDGAPAEGATEVERTQLILDEPTSQIIAFGSEADLSRIYSFVADFDVRQRQVALEILIVSLSDGESLDLGVELRQVIDDGGTLAELSSLFGLSDVNAGQDSITPPTGSGGTAVILDPREYSVVVRALASVSDGRSLSQTQFLVNNNESASINSVVQEPFLSTNASDTVATTSFGGSQSAGTQVTVTPRIGAGDHLSLEYTISLSAFVGESADPSLPPPSQESNLQSSATIPDGFTVVVGGIELTQEAEATTKVPLLGDIPLLGELFKSRSLSQSRSRFYVLIRPTVLRENGFEELLYLSEQIQADLQLESDWPLLEPRIIR